MLNQVFFNMVGSVGLIMILAAFALLQFRKISDDDLLYNLLNIIGAIFVGVYVWSFEAWISVVLNLVWAGIGLWDLLNNIKKRKNEN